MTLLRDIQNAATDSNVDIASVLRKAKILAARLHNAEFTSWVGHELNGYENKEDLPPYRILRVYAKATLTIGFQIGDYPVLTSLLPEKHKAWGETNYMGQPIAEIAELSKKKSIQAYWPQELAVLYGSVGTNADGCLRAWQEINPVDLLGIVDNVRTRLLDFVLRIEDENPDAGEAEHGSHPVPAEKLTSIVHNTFYAPVGNFAQNSTDVQQVAHMTIQPAELKRLVSELGTHLAELHLDIRQEQRARAQIETIKTELDGEPDPAIVRQAGRTIRNITEGAVVSLLATASEPTIWHWIHHVLNMLAGSQ